MFFKREITRTPELYDFKYEVKNFNKFIEIAVTDRSAEGIMNAYNRACEMNEETEGFDAIKINLGNTSYEITEPLVFDTQAKSGLPIVLTSPGKGIISGGESFKGGFEPYKNGIFMRKLSGIKGFRQLYADGKLCVRSSFPKRCGNYKDEFIEGEWLDKERAIEFPKELALNKNISDIEIVAVEKWTCSVAKIKDAKAENGKTVFYLNNENSFLFFDQQRSTKLDKPLCRVENSLDLVSIENEWYFDRTENILYYKPVDGVNVNNIEFTVPVAEKLIEVKAENIYFENISFGYANWDYPSVHGFAEVQGTRYLDKTENGVIWSSPSSAVSVYANEVHFDKCRVFNVGGCGVTLYDGGNFSFANGEVSCTGAGGICVGEFDEKAVPQVNIVIYNNVVQKIGKSYLGGVAIISGYTKNLVIDRNTVSDCGYTGISVGWGWGRLTDSGNYKITNNHVSNIINNYLFDGAGLYLLGRQKSEQVNLISGNYLEGGNGYAGLYFDEFANYYNAHDNVIMTGKKNDWFLLMHDVGYGLNHISVENNLIESKKKHINSYRYTPTDYRPYNKKSSPKSRNVSVKNNYTKKYKNFDIMRGLIIKNSGVKR